MTKSTSPETMTISEILLILAHATPRPWGPMVPIAIGTLRALVLDWPLVDQVDDGIMLANAQLTLLAVNAYEKDQETIQMMQEALQAACKWIAWENADGTGKLIRAALAKVRMARKEGPS